MNYVEGLLSAKNKKIAIIVSRFNSFISDKLLEGAIDAILREGGSKDNLTIYKVPGAFEIPILLSKIVEKDFDGILCLGAIIRGATPHFDFIAQETTKGIAQIAQKAKMPISYGVLTTDTIDQAIERAGTKMGNKGFDAALALLEMINLFEAI
ncbi:MAG: 6,7-dimethyl-8-ribityllumazine synthase [Desulfurella sp.]|jgi:6,7-dimethyl-8-ribityllumazine synthase|uniref:6,7-dimethyl-8-ribityllumazine synthase n=1 Tax=Desulfurella multipotens TaxID=79269 RepID=A0A1G6IKL0_9BACT|nr:MULTISPECIES: 6,7-dimethyl-8-ribityllumazine synthase [Desulfurella]AHF97543.1 6,7-dimethyl-8-ribityllumazine synthase [Desulfurella acetivorans A63]HEX13955.1 6,7-dimethyl-8-ribityllumazine synthase [Desulfurella acetivorans]PMP64915.1 MAG: 6,7-dimethyl-8-ribityllumazine synthase [Desulfurella multipotens]PMP93447.1 MAG: 6,7-dimethyl-8-ribityllumazine synthase [Desulfurella sp.]SDC07028.1 6,7-dimethyl-8-ribityllumazine synthase [Desulfurella multipotens]